MPIPFQWIGLFAMATVFVVMLSLGQMLGRQHDVARHLATVTPAAR